MNKFIVTPFHASNISLQLTSFQLVGTILRGTTILKDSIEVKCFHFKYGVKTKD